MPDETRTPRLPSSPWRVTHAGNIHYGVASADWAYASAADVVYAHAGRDGFGNGSTRDVAEFIATTPDIVAAAVEVIRAANRDPDEGPTGWPEAMSELARLVMPYAEVFGRDAAGGGHRDA